VSSNNSPDGPPASAPGDPSSSAPLIGTTVMGYTFQRVLGEGSMGAVYLAEHRLGGKAAAKVLHSTINSDPVFREQFERETRILFKLDNTHVVRAFGYEALPDGRHCLLMAYHQNTPLNEVIEQQGGSLPLPAALAYAYQVLDGLEAAHKAGVWHRDLKPSNVLQLQDTIQVDGVTYPLLKIVDFGIAHDSAMRAGRSSSSAERSVEVTAATVALPAPGSQELPQLSAGTPLYLSPEQAAITPTDGRSDLYALGVMLFEMVCGQCPFEGQTHQILWQHRFAPPPKLRNVASQAPEEVEQLVAQLLEKAPDRRPQSATEVKHEVLRLLKTQHGGRTQVTRTPATPAVEKPKSTEAGTDPIAPPEAGTDKITPAPGRSWVWLPATGGLLLLGVIVALALRTDAKPNAQTAPADIAVAAHEPPRVEPTPAPPAAPVVPPEPAPAPPAPAPADELAALPAPAARSISAVHAKAPATPPCVPDEAWKASRERDLQDLTKLAAQNGYYEDFEVRERSLTPRVRAATAATCGAVTAQIEALIRRYRQPLNAARP
jgi:serine/threonine-protein kinase